MRAAIFAPLSVLLWLVVFCALSATASADPLFATQDSGVRECLLRHLDEDELARLAQEGRPEDRKLRKRAKAAIAECRALALDLPEYDGPLFDAMAQIDGTVDMDAAMRRVRAAGVGRMALFARSRKALHQDESEVLRLAAKNPDLLILGAPKYFPNRDDLDAAFVAATLQGIEKNGYRFIGEILYSHGDKRGGEVTARGERWIDPLAPGTASLLNGLAQLAAEKGIRVPLLFHYEAYALPRDAAAYHRLFAAWPDQIFIIPHLGFSSPAQVEEFLSAPPNLRMTISKRQRDMGGYASAEQEAAMGPPILAKDMRIRPEWLRVLTRHQDRLLFATDAHMRTLWEDYEQTVRDFRILLGQLPRDVAEKIAFRNAEREYGVRLAP
jgi:hypothetical protein